MYNAKQLEAFFEKIHEEAAEAAQAVYDKYQDEAVRRIRNQMYPGHTVYIGMGTAFVQNSTTRQNVLSLENLFEVIVADHCEYHNKVRAGFILPDKISK